MNPLLGVEETASIARSDPSFVAGNLKQVLNGLETIGAQLNCVSSVETDHAVSTCEQLLREQNRALPLFGVVLAHKSLYQRKNWHCDGGSKTLQNHTCGQTAAPISKLDSAGAIDCGRVNCVEFGLGTTGHNDYTGTPKNPWNPEFICGGSSSGSSAAVAAGLVPASLGTDTGGSIRLPAAACGLVGLKPTYGLINCHGIMALSPSLDTAGPLTRSVRDAAIILDVITDNTASPTTQEIENGIEGFRIGWPTNFFMEGTDCSIVAKVQEVFKLAETCGAHLLDICLPNIETANALNMIITAVEGATIHENTLETRHQDLSEQSLSRLLVGTLIPALDYQKALSLRGITAKRILDETFSCIDILITPVWPYAIPTIHDSNLGANPSAAEMVFRSGHNTRPINYLGFPAIALPIGLDSNGLPLSLQLVGAPYSERKLLRAARALERELEFWAHHSPQISVARQS